MSTSRTYSFKEVGAATSFALYNAISVVVDAAAGHPGVRHQVLSSEGEITISVQFEPDAQAEIDGFDARLAMAARLKGLAYRVVDAT